MPEIVSRQVTSLANTTTGVGKSLPPGTGGKKRTIVITSPATATWANGDTIASGVPIPIGSRFACTNYVSCGAAGASIVLAIGIRNFATKAAISASGIASAIDISAAARQIANNGALVAAGVESTTTVVSELYATISGGTPTANTQLRIEVDVITLD
jgi:hypothetical protein